MQANVSTCSLPCSSRCSGSGMAGRRTEAGRVRWHQAERRAARPEAAKRPDGDGGDGDVAEHDKQRLHHCWTLLQELLLLLRSPGITNSLSMRRKSKNMTTCNMQVETMSLAAHIWSAQKGLFTVMCSDFRRSYKQLIFC